MLSGIEEAKEGVEMGPPADLELVQQAGDDTRLDVSALSSTPQALAGTSVLSTTSRQSVSFSLRSNASSGKEGMTRTMTMPARQLVRQKSVRTGKEDHVHMLARQRRASMLYIEQNLGLKRGELCKAVSSVSEDDALSSIASLQLNEGDRQKLEAKTEYIKKVIAIRQDYKDNGIEENEFCRSTEVRLKGVSYIVPVDESKSGITTVVNSAHVYKVIQDARDVKVRRSSVSGKLKIARKASVSGVDKRYILRDVDLVLKPGRTYLVLGPPGSGKTTLLKAIASLLPTSKKGPQLEGTVTYNGLPIDNDRGVILSNAISFIDQIDRHAPRLTVEETFDFAFQCKGGTHRSPIMEGDPAAIDRVVEKYDKLKCRVNITMEGLGLAHVKDTFVGSTEVRGVSGGQRRRVTVGEMIMWSAPVLCGDEISTGLDAASTYDIVNTLSEMSRITRYTRVVSLLQPSPETFALFDDVIILAEGHVIFAGPILDSVPYFHGLGYEVPDHMDDADFLQAVATPDGADFYRGPGSCPDPETLALLFKDSHFGAKIKEKLNAPLEEDWTKGASFDHSKKSLEDDVETGSGGGSKHNGPSAGDAQGHKLFNKRFSVSFGRATILNSSRFFTLWKRDIRFVRANFIKNFVMGISVGFVFFQTTIIESILGVMFQSMLFIMLGAMTSAPAQIDDRSIFYKHRDANLYPTGAFLLGRTFAFIPQAVMDVTVFGTIIYFLVGLELSASAFFIFYAILIVFTLVMSTMLSACASVAGTKSGVQAMSAVIILLNMLFCGFFVAPNTIPNYYVWIYWWCPLAWAFRALVCNQFLNDSFGQVDENGYTRGQNILISTGFTLNGEPFTRDWIGYSFAYMVPYCVLMLLFAGLGLQYIRFEAGKAGGGAESAGDETDEKPMENESFDPEFKRVDLTFKDICYEVNASTGDGTLRLLNEVNGRLQPGRMCALMGSSGAGKTTLMDVIALRKQSGTITGEVRLNGHLQEEATFRRCSGYVEQFDVQTPELTVRETIEFSANLRLDTRHDPLLKDKQNVLRFVNQVMDMMELRSLENLLVGDDESGGLSFEQRKRLSIAVELAASPSVIFLDEPTSGLDSRAALIVVNSLRKIATTGRTVCATIHQPSSAVFEMFDNLLLMKKGGRVVFCGELGKSSTRLVEYLEARGGAHMNRGENPATWMLNVITKEPVGDKEPIDYAQLYLESDERKELIEDIDKVTNSAQEEDKVTFDSLYAASRWTRHHLVRKRLQLIYWRSPSYNRGRIILSLVIAFLLSSVFLSNRRPDVMSEQEISGVFSTIFLSFIILGILSLTSVLPVMLKIRDVFYRHRAAGMMNHVSLNMALASAEQAFIVITSICFCCVFYFTLGLAGVFSKMLAFWGFFTFNVAINSYFGQAFMCLVRGLGTAGILCSVLIGMNNFFSGLIVRPQYLTGFWQAPYWITPGRYVYEGMMASQFYDDTRIVIASPGTAFYEYLGCEDKPDDEVCFGTVADFFVVFFGGRFKRSNIGINAGVLGFILILARLLTHFALKKFNYTSS